MTQRRITPLFLLSLITTPAFAEEPTTGWSGSAELGYVSTTGNTETTNIKGRANTLWQGVIWSNDTRLEFLNLEEDGERSAGKFLITNKTDRILTEKSYLFIFESYEEDRFSGFEYQTSISAGYGRNLIKNDTMTLDVEAGPGYRISKYDEKIEGESKENEAIIRLYGNYVWALSDNAEFQQELTVEGGSKNTISKSITSLKTTIVGELAMKLSYTVKHTEEVPVGTENSDTETTVTIMYSF
jgi:putative salt-induced outer membrane protein YdiY